MDWFSTYFTILPTSHDVSVDCGSLMVMPSGVTVAISNWNDKVLGCLLISMRSSLVIVIKYDLNIKINVKY